MLEAVDDQVSSTIQSEREIPRDQANQELDKLPLIWKAPLSTTEFSDMGIWAHIR